jgi:hypothetical protein
MPLWPLTNEMLELPAFFGAMGNGYPGAELGYRDQQTRRIAICPPSAHGEFLLESL